MIKDVFRRFNKRSTLQGLHSLFLRLKARKRNVYGLFHFKRHINAHIFIECYSTQITN